MDAGAHYFKTDLQVHTPRDRAWSGERPVTDDDRSSYAREFVAACRRAGLQAVAITDHHDFALFDYIRQAAASELDSDGDPRPAGHQLVVFPGLELTLAVPCQALLILDADFPSQRLSTVLELLAIEPTDSSLGQHDQPTQLAFEDLAELHVRLSESSWLHGHYAILPNVTESGHGTLMRQGMQKKYRDMPCVGGYVDGGATSIGTGNSQKFAGRDPTWGNKQIAIIQTSDSRSATFEYLGRHSTWIKWARPTAEALRQACLAQESRIAVTEPQLPSVVITRLNVTNSQFMGPVDLELNPQYNALIGGRGTGKSTCLEYLRWALCDQPPEPSRDDDMSEHTGRRERLITQTLKPYASQVEVHFRLNEIPHMVRRYAETSEVMLKIGSSELLPASPDDVRSLLPIEAYSQRQLSSVGVRIAELTRFITRPIRERLDEITACEQEAATETRENHSYLQRYRALTKAIARDKFAIESSTQQTQQLRATLSGLSEQDRQRLSSKPLYDEADQVIGGWNRKLSQAESELERVRLILTRISSEMQTSVPEGLPERAALLELQGEIQAVMDQLLKSTEASADTLRSQTDAESRIGILTEVWRKRNEEYLKQYAAAAERSTAHASKLEELRELENRQRQLQENISGQREELATLGDPASRHVELRAHWREVQAERSQVLKEQCEELTRLSDGLIRASVEPGAGTTALRERFAAAVAGSGLRAAKIDTFLLRIAGAGDPYAAWHQAMDELEMLVVDEPDDLAAMSLQSGLSTFAGSELAKMVAKITAETILDLSLMPMDEQPRFDYRTKEQEYIAFEDASAGQQATALLGVLLSSGGPPLLIDQPEDDLDSQAILNVVERLWEAKHRRQLLFASHNANLVVNGDAELVVSCDYRAAGDHSAGRIKLQGAIDIPEVRTDITVVMEGGEKAFRLRKEKYGF
jgi:chromosome segregation protein